ncbi:MAG: DUF3612 domain-containing protein [Marinomonas sp.]|uniref:DUF3612 domain-containing protein n=1 Tax=Marinomonas sp. TaxID=1904862 RepID=UPI003F94A88C
MSVAKILNINWVERGIDSDARLIYSRGAVCPGSPSCYKQCEVVGLFEESLSVEAISL